MKFGDASGARLWYPTGVIALFLVMILAFALPQRATAQEILGQFKPGDILPVDLPIDASALLLVVEIDGREVPAEFLPGQIIVVVPEGLTGTRHDLRIYERSGADRVAIGLWIFETPATGATLGGAFLAETGWRATPNVSEPFATGALQLGYQSNDGRWKGGLSISRGALAGVDGNEELEVADIYLETGTTALGDDLVFRIGNQQDFSDTLIFDTQSRRGLSLRLLDPASVYALSGFVLDPQANSEPRNLTGLGKADRRVAGVAATVFPPLASEVKLDFGAYSGETDALPSGNPGSSSAASLTANLPLIDEFLDLTLASSASQWSDAGTAGSTDAIATEVEVNIGLTPERPVTDMTLTFGTSAIEDGFYTALNPDVISGERITRAGLEYVSPFWEWAAEAAYTKTNFAGAATNPTDEITGLGFDLMHDPGEVTGGLLNGTKFFASAAMERQDRLVTPSGAIAPQDNTVRNYLLGVEKRQPTWRAALFVSRDQVIDRFGGGTDSISDFVSGQWAYVPNDAGSVAITALTGLRRTPAATYAEHELAVIASKTLGAGNWTVSGALELTASEDPAIEGGRLVSTEVARKLTERSALVTSYAYGWGASAPRDTTGKGWEFSVFLRTDFAFGK